MDNAEGVLTSKTVVGEPIRIDDTIIIPLSDVTIGCGAGANNSLNGTKKDSGMGGFSAKMSPTAVLIIRDGYTKVVNVKTQDTLGKLVDSLPELIDKLLNKDTLLGYEKVETKDDDGNVTATTWYEVYQTDLVNPGLDETRSYPKFTGAPPATPLPSSS